ncbi:ATP-binding cassette domain-containing protein, partial [Micromonospora zhanjiangensis]
MAAWRRQLAWVPQRAHLFAASLTDNIRLGQDDAAADRTVRAARVDRAVRAAALDDVVAALPEGLDTLLGERGHGLSGGQWQRVAMARAFLRDAPVVLLDEPTARLDGDSESAVLDATRRLVAGRTAVLVAHRPALLAVADRVLRVEDGRVTDLGAAPDPAVQEREEFDSPELSACPSGTRHPEEFCSPEPAEVLRIVPAPAGPASGEDAGPDGGAERGGRFGAELRVLRLARPYLGRLVGAGLLATGTELAGLILMATATWLLITAAGRPTLDTLTVAIVAVRALAVGRGVLRYTERLAGHDATLRVVTDVRAAVFATLAAGR